MPTRRRLALSIPTLVLIQWLRIAGILLGTQKLGSRGGRADAVDDLVAQPERGDEIALGVAPNGRADLVGNANRRGDAQLLFPAPECQSAHADKLHERAQIVFRLAPVGRQIRRLTAPTTTTAAGASLEGCAVTHRLPPNVVIPH